MAVSAIRRNLDYCQEIYKVAKRRDLDNQTSPFTMISPVVQSGFGTRPLLEVPAMEVPGAGEMAVTTIISPQVQSVPAAQPAPTVQAPVVQVAAPQPLTIQAYQTPAMQTFPAATMQQSYPVAAVPAIQPPAMASITLPVQPVAPLNPFPSAANPMLGSGLYNVQPTSFSAGAYPAGMQQYQDHHGRHRSAPQGPLYNAQGRQYYYGPNGEIIFPPPAYPGVANPFTGSVPNFSTHPQGYNPYGGPPGRFAYPGNEPMPFDIKCELEFGRVTHIDLRESPNTFRGIPDFIKLELLRTYGEEPHTECRIRYAHGEFHIYAGKGKQREKHEHRTYRDSYSEDGSSIDGDYGETDVDSYAQINPRGGRVKPRRIVHEKGWNRFR